MGNAEPLLLMGREHPSFLWVRLFEAKHSREPSPGRGPGKNSGEESAPRAGRVPLPGRVLRAASSGLPPPVPLCHTQLSTSPSPVRSQEDNTLLSHWISIERTRKILWRSLPGLLARYPELLQQVLPPRPGGVPNPPPSQRMRMDFIPCGTNLLA